MDIKQKMVFTGSLLMFLAIILGAMASHYLERIISPESILSFEVGVRYMVYHALALLVFSGSIFLLSFKALFRFSISWLGPITPIGGGY